MLRYLHVQLNRLAMGYVDPPRRSEERMKVLLVHSHPLKDSFSNALTRAAKIGLEEAGHDVEVLSLHDMDGKGKAFQPVLTPEERAKYLTIYPEPSDDIRPIIDSLKKVDALVFVYPTWWCVPDWLAC